MAMSSEEIQDNREQLELFTEYKLGSVHLSRIVPLWDLLPLYLFSRRNEVPADTAAADIASRKHEFTHRDEKISVEVRPAMLRTKAGNRSRFIFPGEREQLIASTIRALAVRGDAHVGTTAAKDGGTLITVAFTIRQLRSELEHTGHTLSHAEIMEGLDILGKTFVTLTRSRSDEEPIDDEFPFYTRHMAQGDKRIVVLNPVESQQILAGAYRSLNYTRLMSLADPLARWLYQYLHAEHRGVVKPELGKHSATFEITLQLLFERGIVPPTKELRKAIQRVRNALDVLSAAGVLYVTKECPSGYQETVHKAATAGRSKIVGAAWKPILSFQEADEIINENSEATYRKPEFNYLALESRLIKAKPIRERLIHSAERARQK